MTSTINRPTTGLPAGQAAVFDNTQVARKGNVVVSWITSTDHKTIGYLYLITSFIYFCIGGVLALVIRVELFTPGVDVVPTNEA